MITTEKLKSLTIGQSAIEKMKDKKHLQRVKNYAQTLKPGYGFTVKVRDGNIVATRIIIDTPSSTSARLESMKPGQVMHFGPVSQYGSIRALASMVKGEYDVSLDVKVIKRG